MNIFLKEKKYILFLVTLITSCNSSLNKSQEVDDLMKLNWESQYFYNSKKIITSIEHMNNYLNEKSHLKNNKEIVSKYNEIIIELINSINQEHLVLNKIRELNYLIESSETTDKFK